MRWKKMSAEKKWYRSIWTKYNITQTVVDACWFECFPSYCRLLFEVSSHLFSLSPFVFCFLSTHFPFSFVCVRNILNILQSRFESKAKKKGLKQSPLELLWRTAKYDERGSKSRQIWLKESAWNAKNTPKIYVLIVIYILHSFFFLLWSFFFILAFFIWIGIRIRIEGRAVLGWQSESQAITNRLIYEVKYFCCFFFFFFFFFEIKMGAHMLSHISLWYKLK